MKSIGATFEPVFIRPERRMWLSLLALTVVCGFLAFDVRPAKATCGDYLAHHGMMDHSDASAPMDTSPMGSLPHRKPCHGPSCQKAPVHSPLPVPVVSVESQDRWVMTVSLRDQLPETTSFLVQTNEPTVLSTIADRLDRPPKA